MDDIVWFPVSDQEKKALEQLCRVHGITLKEWFDLMLRGSVQGVIPLMRSIPGQRRRNGDKIDSEHKIELGEAAR